MAAFSRRKLDSIANRTKAYRAVLLLWFVSSFFLLTAFDAYSLNEELRLAYASDYAQICTHTILLNENVTARVTEIGCRLVTAARENKISKNVEQENFEYTFRIMNDPLINAFSIPGGYVYVNTGLLDILQNEDELAAVLAHEIQHVEGHHLIKQIHQAQASQVAGTIGGMLIGVALGVAVGAATAPSSSGAYAAPNPWQTQLQSMAIDSAVQLGQGMGEVMSISMITGYSKNQELEADARGLDMMKKAGYDPQGMVSMFKRFIEFRNKLTPPAKLNEKQQPSISSNYKSSLINAEPGLDDRLKQVEVLLESKK